MKALVVDRYTNGSIARLKQMGLEVEHIPKAQLTPESLEGVDFLFIRSRTEVYEGLLKKAQSLKLIITATSGFDHIDWEACEKRDIKLGYCPEANVQSVKELTINFIFTFLNQSQAFHSQVLAGQWKDQLPKRKEASGRTLGIVGMGRIGQSVGLLAKQLGMNVIYHDPYITSSPVGEALGFTEVLGSSDILSLHVPLTQETHHLINYATLEQLSDEAYIINTSRGKVVQELALIEALREGKVAGAALDVFQKEPLPAKSALRQLPNVLLSPHVGAFTEEALERASMEAVKTLEGFLKDKRLINSVPPNQDWAHKIIREKA